MYDTEGFAVPPLSPRAGQGEDARCTLQHQVRDVYNIFVLARYVSHSNEAP